MPTCPTTVLRRRTWSTCWRRWLERAYGDAVRSLLRLGDRRDAAGRVGRRLAGERRAGSATPDQNTGLRYASPATAAVEEIAAGWLLELFGLPAGADVGFVTGATMANFTCLASARSAVLSRVGWDLARGPARWTALRCGCWSEPNGTRRSTSRRGTWVLRSPTLVPADEQGRIRVDALTAALAELDPTDPVIVCLQAGNIHSGAFDPLTEAIHVAPPAWCVGAHRWRLRLVGRRVPGVASPRHGAGRCRFLDNRRTQDPQRPRRLRDRDRRRPGGRCGPRSGCMPPT